MRIDLKPQIEALLEAQVAAGHFESIEEAIGAAVLGMSIDESKIGSLGWARPFLDEAEKAIEAGATFGEEDAYAELEKRFGKL